MYKLPLLLSLIACTPGMHRGYRASITVAGGVAQMVDTRMTQYAVRHGVPEANPMFGSNPSPELLAAGGAAGVLSMFALHEAVERLPDRGPESEWVRDGIATIPFIIEGFMVYRNIGNIGTDSWRNW